METSADQEHIILTAALPGATEDKPRGVLVRSLDDQVDGAAGTDAAPRAPALDRVLSAHPDSKVERISSPEETKAEPGTLTRHFSHESDAAHTEVAPLAVEPSPDKTLQHDAFDAHGNILQEASHKSFNEGANANAEGRQTSERTLLPKRPSPNNCAAHVTAAAQTDQT